MGKEYLGQVFVQGQVPVTGLVLCYDNFAESLPFSAYGDTPEITRSLTEFYNQPASLKFADITGSPSGGENSGMQKAIVFGKSNQIQLELLFYFNIISYFGQFTILMNVYTGSVVLNTGIRWNNTGDKWQYLNSAGSWADISGGAQTLAQGRFIKLQFSLNVNTAKYKTLKVSNLELDISTLALQSSSDSSAATIELLIYGSNAGANSLSGYIDYILVTQS